MSHLTHNREPTPKVIHWRMIWVGVGTVFGTTIICLIWLSLLDGQGGMPATVWAFAFGYAGFLSAVLLVPMMGLWTLVFNWLRRDRTERLAAIMSSGICVLSAVGAICACLAVAAGQIEPQGLIIATALLIVALVWAIGLTALAFPQKLIKNSV